MALEVSETMASAFIREVEAKFEPLRDMPLLGSDRRQLATGLRVIFHKAYAIYYMLDIDVIVIMRVLHGSRDVIAIAEQGGFIAD